MWPYYTRCGISSLCDATTPKGFGLEASKWETWFFGCDNITPGFRGTKTRAQT
jgi:hypothetical protein